MTIPTILVVFALGIALVDEFRSNGRSLASWAAVLICLSLLWGNLNLG